MSGLAFSNSLTRALYVGASLVALEVSHQVMVTGPCGVVAAVASAAGRRREGEGRHQRGGRYATPHEFSLRVKARVVLRAAPSAARRRLADRVAAAAGRR